MQPPTDPSAPGTTRDAGPRGDEADLYRQHHRDLERTVARVVNAPGELIEDACQTAWAILLRCQPERSAILAWLRVVAIHEAYRLLVIQRRDARLDRLASDSGGWHEVIADPRTLDVLLEAREALCLLAGLPEPQRDDLVLLVAGFSYREIADLTGGRTFTNVNKHLAKARARVRLARLNGTRSRCAPDTDPRGRDRGGPTSAESALQE
jgi:DNA-directed RNA polymerase specialized sigma24 family protein